MTEVIPTTFQKYVVYHTDYAEYFSFSDDRQWMWDADKPFLFVPGVIEAMYHFCFTMDSANLSQDIASVFMKVRVEHLMVYPCNPQVTMTPTNVFLDDFKLEIHDGVMLKIWGSDEVNP